MKKENSRTYLVIEHEYVITTNYTSYVIKIHGCFNDAARANEEAKTVIGSGKVSHLHDVSVLRWNIKTQKVKMLYRYSPTLENSLEAIELKKRRKV